MRIARTDHAICLNVLLCLQLDRSNHVAVRQGVPSHCHRRQPDFAFIGHRVKRCGVHGFKVEGRQRSDEGAFNPFPRVIIEAQIELHAVEVGHSTYRDIQFYHLARGDRALVSNGFNRIGNIILYSRRRCHGNIHRNTTVLYDGSLRIQSLKSLC